MGACLSSQSSGDVRRRGDGRGRMSNDGMGGNRRISTGTALTGLTHENERKRRFKQYIKNLRILILMVLKGVCHFSHVRMDHGMQQRQLVALH